MTVTQKATISGFDEKLLARAMLQMERAQRDIVSYREIVVELVEKYSFREVARLTGLSTNTLQRWKREAGK